MYILAAWSERKGTIHSLIKIVKKNCSFFPNKLDDTQKKKCCRFSLFDIGSARTQPQPKLLAVHYCHTTVDKAAPVINSSNNISETVAHSQLINSSVQRRGVQSRAVPTASVWSKQDPGGKKGLVLAGWLVHFNKSMR